jgi:hypothetical protein
MSQPVYLPAHMVTVGGALPHICARHGRPGTRQKKVRFVSRPPLWVYLFLVTGFLIPAIIATALRKTLKAPSWSFCDRCLARRRSLLIAMAGVLTVMVISLIIPNDGIVVLGWLVGLIPLIILGIARSWGVIAAAEVTRDGLALRLRKPDEGYVLHLPAVPPPAPVQPWQVGAPRAV